jgi:hypothetical protein
MKFLKSGFLALLAIALISGGAFAANIYKDTYTTEDSSGNWTMSGDLSVGDDLTVTGDITGSGIFQSPSKSLITYINDQGDTPGTVTAAKTGYTFLIAATDSTTAYQLTLPACADGLTYTFVNATLTTVSVKPYSTADTIKYAMLDLPIDLNQASADKITSPATQSSLKLVGYASGGETKNIWYVAEMTGTWTDGGV